MAFKFATNQIAIGVTAIAGGLIIAFDGFTFAHAQPSQQQTEQASERQQEPQNESQDRQRQSQTKSKRWANESQVGIVKTTGNTETENYTLKQILTFTRERDLARFSGNYFKLAARNKASQRMEETARRWDSSLRYERSLDEKWSAILGYTVESDIYAGIEDRFNYDFGFKYKALQTTSYDISTEIGYRYVHQNNVDHTQEHFNAGRLYLEGNYRFNKLNSTRAWVESISNLDLPEEYKINSEFSLTAGLTTMFSLKVAYLIKHNNRPEGRAKKTDTLLTTALVAKF